MFPCCWCFRQDWSGDERSPSVSFDFSGSFHTKEASALRSPYHHSMSRLSSIARSKSDTRLEALTMTRWRTSQASHASLPRVTPIHSRIQIFVSYLSMWLTANLNLSVCFWIIPGLAAMKWVIVSEVSRKHGYSVVRAASLLAIDKSPSLWGDRLTG